MNILVIGGNRLIGKHLVENLLNEKHNVTIANRGLTPDDFGHKINRIILERTSEESIARAIGNNRYDIVYDSLAFSSNDVRCLLNVINCDKYIMTSTVSVYSPYMLNMYEKDFNPLNHSLKWRWRDDDVYSEVKRQAECALYQKYSQIPSIAVRFPFVVGNDDYLRRLNFYAEHIAKQIPIFVDNVDEQMSFITSAEAGKFLAYLAAHEFEGKINASACGTILMRDIISYIEQKTDKTAIISGDGVAAPYNGAKSHSMNLQKAKDLGFEFSDVNSWFWDLLDDVIAATIA